MQIRHSLPSSACDRAQSNVGAPHVFLSQEPMGDEAGTPGGEWDDSAPLVSWILYKRINSFYGKAKNTIPHNTHVLYTPYECVLILWFVYKSLQLVLERDKQFLFDLEDFNFYASYLFLWLLFIKIKPLCAKLENGNI